MSENTRQEAEKTVALVDEVNAVVLPEPVEANAVVPLKDAPAEVSGEIRSRMDELDMADTNSIVSFGAGAQTELQEISQAMLDGASVLVGGAFLLTPGVLTDLLGFSLLFPLSRRWIQRRLKERLERQIADGSIRVVAMGPGMGFGGATPQQGPGLDPSKGIVVEPEE